MQKSLKWCPSCQSPLEKKKKTLTASKKPRTSRVSKVNHPCKHIPACTLTWPSMHAHSQHPNQHLPHANPPSLSCWQIRSCSSGQLLPGSHWLAPGLCHLDASSAIDPSPYLPCHDCFSKHSNIYFVKADHFHWSQTTFLTEIKTHDTYTVDIFCVMVAKSGSGLFSVCNLVLL